MGRYLGPSCRQCRREGVPLYLKGSRCLSDKCALRKKKVHPGMKAKKRRSKLSEYGRQLREKQKVKRFYGLFEKQFSNTFKTAKSVKGKTGEEFLALLETRLDNVVYRMGFASSRKQARQIIRHRHILVNGKKVDIPSYIVNPGDEIEVKEKSKKLRMILESLKNISRDGAPKWLDVDVDKVKGSVLHKPERDDVSISTEEQLIVELYSK